MVMLTSFRALLFFQKSGNGFRKLSETMKCMQQTCGMSRFSANNILAGSDIFRFSDYDCIGFDLDSTLCHYNISNNVKLIYSILSRFLVEKKGYQPLLLYQPIDDKLDILQKGLIIDLKKGNIMKLDDDGLINKVCHGYRVLSEEEIFQCYGPNKEWEYATCYANNMLESWNGPRSENIRALLDYYDVSTSLCFSRCVETLNITRQNGSDYNIWPDILDGLIYMFSREHYSIDEGEFFPALKYNPELYYRKCNPSVIEFIKELKRNNKLLFVVTGSNIDYANHTGSYCLGSHWNELFDFVVYYSKKPGFFVGNRPFYTTKDLQEGKQIDLEDIKIGSGVGYSQGNWDDLYKVLTKHLGKKPHCLYVGDNLLQDIYTPSISNKCDTVTINEEMIAEGIAGSFKTHPDEKILTSNVWGSYYSVQDFGGVKIPSIWAAIIRKHSKICIPNIEAVARYPINQDYLTFSDSKFCTAGFHPAPPMTLLE